jgi:hypothetical protein
MATRPVVDGCRACMQERGQPITGDQGMNDQYNERNDEPLHTEKIITDRKIYFIDLKENARGKFVKITEDVRGRRDTILLPCEALEEFINALQNIQEAYHSHG